ncbi:MAG: TolC family protein [Castellaniella sp.]|uniref:TolC family protein n=1 Tax=Castellaniella sp. TaxID=1955812 RepID=UPI002A36D03A|nr:TolC family protein [Castellaniella sp.]MDY0308496.1 TolC family protein [Castellaniella sp.]
MTAHADRPTGQWRTRAAVLALATVLALSGTAHAWATDLLQAWQAAQTHDPELATARQNLRAGQARADQADSLWRPTLDAQASVGRATQESQTRGAHFSAPALGAMDGANFDTSIRNGSRSEYGVQLRQPLIDLGRDAQAQQLRHAARQAEAAWTIAEQQAALRIARRYFDVLTGMRRLETLQSQQRAIQRLLAQAQARYQAGDASILDTHEAQARLGQIDTLVDLATTRLELARSAFTQASGLPAKGLVPLQEDAPTITARPDQPLAAWLDRVAKASPELRQALEAAAMASERAEGLRAIAQPTLSLVGAAGRTYQSGTGQYGDAGYAATQWSVGLELRIPLYTGGMRDARYREALAERDGARFQIASTQQGLNLRTQAAWLSLETGPGRIQALRQALQAGMSRRDATRLGVETGERTLLDQLDAEQALAQSEFDLYQAMADLVIDRLELQALAGSLDQQAMATANCALSGAHCPATKHQ